MSRLDSFPDAARAFCVMATVELPLAEPDWPRFRATLAEAAAEGGWSMRDYDSPKALGGHLRRQDGVQVSYKQWAWANPPEARATLYVVAPRGEEGWRAAAEPLLRRLAQAWPSGRVEAKVLVDPLR